VDWLDRLSDDFSGVFWIIIMLGSWVASAINKSKQSQSAEPEEEGAVGDYEFEDLLVAEVELSKLVNEKPKPLQQPPPPPRQSPAVKAELPAIDFDAMAADLGSKFVAYESSIGNAEAATISQVKSWQPSTSWRKAFILHEIFGPPRAVKELKDSEYKF